MADDPVTQEHTELKTKYFSTLEKVKDVPSLKEFTKDLPSLPGNTLKLRRQLKGHQAKVTSMEWAKSGYQIVSAAQDGTIIVWDAVTSSKISAIAMQGKNMWVMACCMSPSGEYVACGGLDNLCSVYNIKKDKPSVPIMQLEHGGSLGKCTFLPQEKQILTCDGDTCCTLWDLETRQKVLVFKEHDGGVNGITVNPEATNFISGACDGLCKLWDFRNPKSSFSFETTKKAVDVNCCTYFPSGNAFGAGYSDSSVLLFDIRAYQPVNEYPIENPGRYCYVTDIAFSPSGRLLFSTYYEGGVCRIWDTLKAEQTGVLEPHNGAVSAVSISSDGRAVATSSFDGLVRVWVESSKGGSSSAAASASSS